MSYLIIKLFIKISNCASSIKSSIFAYRLDKTFGVQSSLLLTEIFKSVFCIFSFNSLITSSIFTSFCTFNCEKTQALYKYLESSTVKLFLKYSLGWSVFKIS